MDLREEMRARISSLGRERVQGVLFTGLSMPPATRTQVVATLLAGHHLLLTGPPGVGKTTLAQRMVHLLPDRRIVAGCPVNCSTEAPACPWCRQRLSRGEKLRAESLPGSERIRKVAGSSELKASDLVGDYDPQMALEHGIFDLRAFVPGKLLRANGCLLLIDFIDRVPERVLNAILLGLAGGGVPIGNRDELLPLDVLIVATGSRAASGRMPVDLADHFDWIALDNAWDSEFETRLLAGGRNSAGWIRPAMEVVRRTRCHEDLSRGVSTRGAIRYGELLASFSDVIREQSPEKIIPEASQVALPQRVEVGAHAVANRSAREIVDEICGDVLGIAPAQKDRIPLSPDKVRAIVDEIARIDHFRKPLKFGLFDLLLKRIKRFPESHLAGLHQEMLDHLLGRIRDRQMEDNLTMDLLCEIEKARERNERISGEMRARLEAEALVQTVEMLEERQILSRREKGYKLSRRGIALLLEKLAPRAWEENQLTGLGKHRTGRKHRVGEGRVVGTRAWRFGDCYRDFSLKDTLRRAIRNRHPRITREDLQVVTRDIRTRMDILLCLDLSGTMDQLEKLWYAKESAIALALASSGHGDRMGLVTFSNLAKVVSDLSSNTYLLTEKILDLDLHENAFTNLGFGLLTARGLFARHSRGHSKQHIILVSDGDATAPHPSPTRFAVQEAAKAARKGITVSCICINEENADPDLLGNIARIGRGRMTLIENTRSMKQGLMQEHNAVVR